MAKKTARLTTEERAELARWALQVAKAVSPAELNGLLREHRAIARDPSIDAESRRTARRQADALNRCVK
jgi:hypothetical protein